MEEPGPCMAQIVNGQDLALSLLWSCSPKSKAKTRPGHAAKARQLAMLLQRRRHVKQGVPRQCWCESLPAQCAIRPTVKRVCVSGNAPCGWADAMPAELSGAKLPRQTARRAPCQRCGSATTIHQESCADSDAPATS